MNGTYHLSARFCFALCGLLFASSVGLVNAYTNGLPPVGSLVISNAHDLDWLRKFGYGFPNFQSPSGESGFGVYGENYINGRYSTKGSNAAVPFHFVGYHVFPFHTNWATISNPGGGSYQISLGLGSVEYMSNFPVMVAGNVSQVTVTNTIGIVTNAWTVCTPMLMPPGRDMMDKGDFALTMQTDLNHAGRYYVQWSKGTGNQSNLYQPFNMLTNYTLNFHQVRDFSTNFPVWYANAVVQTLTNFGFLSNGPSGPVFGNIITFRTNRVLATSVTNLNGELHPVGDRQNTGERVVFTNKLWAQPRNISWSFQDIGRNTAGSLQGVYQDPPMFVYAQNFTNTTTVTAKAFQITNLDIVGGVVTVQGTAANSATLVAQTSGTLNSWTSEATNTSTASGEFTLTFPARSYGYFTTNIIPPGWLMDGSFNPFYNPYWLTNVFFTDMYLVRIKQP